MNAKELKAEIDARAARLAPQLAELEGLRRKHRETVSREWIAANNVTAAKVQLSSAEGLPYFGDVMTFARWMKDTGCSAPWAEWNGLLYSSAELMAGRMCRDAPGYAEHVAP
jgi:hypothetical protein